MHRIVLPLVLLTLLGAPFGAQGYVYNPSDTPGTGSGMNAAPFGIYSAWRYQFIIDSRVLVKAIGNNFVKIVDLAFAPSNTQTLSAGQFQVRMHHTTHTSFGAARTTRFADLIGPCPTECYNGPMKWSARANTWSDVGLNAGFWWNGFTSIVVEIRYRAASWGRVNGWMGSTIPRAFTNTNYSADPYNAPTWRSPIAGEFMGLKHRLTYVKDNILLAADTIRLFSPKSAVRYFNGPAGHFYQIAASLGQSQRLSVGKGAIYLNLDGLLLLSLLAGPPTFTGYAGQLDAQGNANAYIRIPYSEQLIGVGLYHAGIAYDRTGVTGWTNTKGTVIAR